MNILYLKMFIKYHIQCTYQNNKYMKYSVHEHLRTQLI